ncbi:MaoC family dehydratase [Frigidibacter mobilis]|uniref:3-alpha,7-alpha,12-alpha-trihydroxy-5-beta-cholest-24-enoyl-CoA hydratase n=1 Tax=Frigidibacter mobilis TaxID=1335048 RepID=A0A159Z712_9RHOB|nr:MaoC family dehydratase [Frigidibacter mobilis]AMY70330.1 3-alpha,7-alpha,12-alpha-trihydroxy-5-beta- cholest-24-enoyl-CoA hydratase [Frigidibacter mobilis]
MALDPDKIFDHRFSDRSGSFPARDAILYALCCGAGQDGDLRFVHEDGLTVLPSFGQNLCFDDSWMEPSGVALATVVHGGLDLRMHRPLTPGAALTVRQRIAGLTDKGEGRPALILHQTDVLEQGEVLFTSLSNLFVMGGGGFGGSQGDTFEMIRTPDRAPDRTSVLATRPDSPLLFRLLGDQNPLHVRPEVAQAAGFAGPILHGANTFGIVCHTLLALFCGSDAARLTRFAARFSGPLYPGERLAVSWWLGEGRVQFAARSVERDSPVLDGGLAETR